MRDQKLNKLNEERLEKERARMKVAYDHAKMWFGEIKKALEKDDGFFLEPSLGIQISEAKVAAASDKKKPC